MAERGIFFGVFSRFDIYIGGTTMAFGLDMGPESVVNIKVVGVGGGGNNVVYRMVRTGT